MEEIINKIMPLDSRFILSIGSHHGIFIVDLQDTGYGMIKSHITGDNLVETLNAAYNDLINQLDG